MDNIITILGPVCIGYAMAILSVFFGAWLASRFMTGGQGGVFAPEPKGDVFTVETPDDMAPYPDEVKNDAEEHIMEKTNRFLETLTAGKVGG